MLYGSESCSINKSFLRNDWSRNVSVEADELG